MLGNGKTSTQNDDDGESDKDDDWEKGVRHSTKEKKTMAHLGIPALLEVQCY